MFSSIKPGVGAYTKVGIETGVPTASPRELLLMLYQGAIIAITNAQQHLTQNNVAAKGAAVSKAISIIDDGLRASLDLSVGGDLARNLSDLYTYMSRRLLEANLKNDAAGFDEVKKLLQQLESAWQTLPDPTSNPAQGQGHAIAPGQVANYGNI